MFGGGLQLGQTNSFGTPTAAAPVKDFEVASPPEDSVSSMEFSPATLQQNYLVSGSWDFSVSLKN